MATAAFPSGMPPPPPPPVLVPPPTPPPSSVAAAPGPTTPSTSPSLGPGTGAGPGNDDKITLNKREMRLGLRHRDSFAVHTAHLHQQPHGPSVHHHNAAATVGGLNGGVGSGAGASLTRNLSDPAMVRHQQSSMSQLFGAIPPPPPRSELDGEGEGEEGGPESDDLVVVNPADDDDIMRVLEDLAVGADGEGRGGDSATGAGAGVPLTPEEITRKKNKLRSMIKGVGSYLGLRKSKRRRQAEAAAMAAQQGGGAGAGAGAGTGGGVPPPGGAGPGASGDASGSAASGGLFKKLLFRSRSSPALQSDDERLRVPGSPIVIVPGTPTIAGGDGHHHHHHARATPSSASSEPNIDENGLYAPNHRRDTSAVKGVLKSPNGRKPPTPAPAPAPVPNKRRISFMDTHGAPLEVVHYVEDLHYSDGSEHVDWDDEDEAGKCAVM
jgi:hypothetical protein